MDCKCIECGCQTTQEESRREMGTADWESDKCPNCLHGRLIPITRTCNSCNKCVKITMKSEQLRRTP